MLETFNPVVRPIAVKYDPLSVVRAAELPPLFSLSAVPGQRRSRQPLRVALNARFRLPAGEYELTVKGSDEAGTVPESDAGTPNRPGRPAARDVAVAADSWKRVTAPFPGTARCRIRRISCVAPGGANNRGAAAPSAADRRRGTPIREPYRAVCRRTLASRESFFHDGDSYPETEGLWVRGRSTTRLTILKPSESQTSVMLAIHSGARPNSGDPGRRATGRSESSWFPAVTRKIAIPSNAGRTVHPALGHRF